MISLWWFSVVQCSLETAAEERHGELCPRQSRSEDPAKETGSLHEKNGWLHHIHSTRTTGQCEHSHKCTCDCWSCDCHVTMYTGCCLSEQACVGVHTVPIGQTRHVYGGCGYDVIINMVTMMSSLHHVDGTRVWGEWLQTLSPVSSSATCAERTAESASWCTG